MPLMVAFVNQWLKLHRRLDTAVAATLIAAIFDIEPTAEVQSRQIRGIRSVTTPCDMSSDERSQQQQRNHVLLFTTKRGTNR